LSAFHVGIRIGIGAEVVLKACGKWTFSTDHSAGYSDVEGDSSRCDRRDALSIVFTGTSMSSPQLRRADRAMSEQRAYEMLERGFSGQLATIGADGYPYCIPLLYIWMDGELYVHTSSARGHLRANVEREPRICFEIDEPDQVFDYGRFECDSGLAYRSLILFGKIRIVEERAVKQRFCEALMEKYGKPDSTRPKSFFPRIDGITVYAIAVERMTGKEMALPALSEQWPAKDRTKTPNARP
jgi:nitroimidazol reductase NimA-like FMN-containing flavoprotein (pyridoxamine 5'-phosphate oxidase superfamily)